MYCSKSAKLYDLFTLQHTNDDVERKNEKGKKPEEKFLTAAHIHSLPGHTGFITIATLPPRIFNKTLIE